ncbi:MAG: exosome complex RNA-binding protein Rrp4 [Candidatus Thermoplasmatota archaeon]
MVPGELVANADEFRPGQNTYQEGTSIYALRLGVKSVRGNSVNVISLSGRYEPCRGDMVIGTVAETGPSNWYVTIGAANDVGMHVNDVPWRVEFGETSRYLAVGDTVLLKIVHVGEMKKAQVSMKDRQCRKLTGGLILEVAPTKVPRIVGRNGSMIQLIKDATNVRIFVGQNGVIWMDGENDDVQLALEAFRKIEAEAHTTGLTDRMKAWLEEKRPSASRPQKPAAPEEEPPAAEGEAREERPPRERREERPRREFREEPRRPRSAEGDAAPRFGGGAPREARPRRFDSEERAPARPPRDDRTEERPRREFREERPARARESSEERPPRRTFEEARPRRTFEEERPRRTFEEERPRRTFEEERPRRTFDEERPRVAPRREESEDRPMRRAAPRDDDEDRPARPLRVESEEEGQPMRRPMDEDRPMRRDDSSGGDGGHSRRRRGGRGRGHGGSSGGGQRRGEE